MEQCIPLRAFHDNYIWLLGESDTLAQADPSVPRFKDGGAVVVVDPGDARPVIKYLGDHSLTCVAVFVTHHHYDHIDGIADLVRLYSAPVYGPAHESIPGIDYPLEEGDRVNLRQGSLQFTVLEVPGHTSGHIAFYGHQYLFCGDTLFGGGCGRLFEGTAQQMHQSLSRLVLLPDDTLVCCAHEYTDGNLKFASAVEPDNEVLLQRIAQTASLRAQDRPTLPSTIGLEKLTNPFLRCEYKNVKLAAEQFCGRPLATASEVFSVLRYWKDVF